MNVVNQSIVVTAKDTATPDPDPTRLLVNNTVLFLEFLSKMSLSLYVSVLSDAFSYNLNITQTFSGMARPEAALRATEASFEAILDDILGVYGSGQIMINNEAKYKKIQGGVTAVFSEFNKGRRRGGLGKFKV